MLLPFPAWPGNTRSQEAGLPQLFVPQTAHITTSYDAAKDQTTVRLAPAKISGNRAHYHSLSYSVFYSYPGKTKRLPQKLSFELLTVVKRRLLKIDLYVVFIVDGEEIFLPSSRSAIKHPVPGKRWVGERLEFHMRCETLLRITRARKLAVSMDGLIFDFAETDLQSLRDFAQAIETSPSGARLGPMKAAGSTCSPHPTPRKPEPPNSQVTDLRAFIM